jgi:hypothetical protein
MSTAVHDVDNKTVKVLPVDCASIFCCIWKTERIGIFIPIPLGSVRRCNV